MHEFVCQYGWGRGQQSMDSSWGWGRYFELIAYSSKNFCGHGQGGHSHTAATLTLVFCPC